MIIIVTIIIVTNIMMSSSWSKLSLVGLWLNSTTTIMIIIVITDHHQVLFLNQVGPWQRIASRGQTHFGRSRNPTSSSTW